uniref:Reverse transcriptase domain-containing protein n=1 Tax=Fagus sylvatica TaxID=28930 RepID=A0A2N9HS98_FAGSY
MGEASSGPKPFKFEQAWTRDGSCAEVIREEWAKPAFGSPQAILIQKQTKTNKRLKWWNKNIFGTIQKRIEELGKAIDDIQAKEPTMANCELEATLQAQYQEFLRREEAIWRQKSRISWLTTPDLNTKFFQVSTIVRRKRNQINLLKKADGNWTQDQAEIDNTAICSVPNEEEIKDSLFSMESLKSPGPDGLPPLFYKHYWSIVKKDVIAAVQNFFTSGKLVKQSNHTFIALIPKVEGASKVNQFRPISLCNVSYKIAAKILASRLKGILPRIVSPWQGAFVPGRLIQDNTIIAQEVVSSMKKSTAKDGFMAIKLDMEKAYDMMEWSFLLHILKLLGFCDKWIELIRECISSPSFSVLINGSPHGMISPSRGLRQGDPLSPFLFILGTEVLSRILITAEENHLFKGFTLARTCPRVSHLLFADDLIIFASANREGAKAIQKCLSKYQSWSGQKVNMNKSAIMFSKKVPRGAQSSICRLLHLSSTPFPCQILGIAFKQRVYNYKNTGECVAAATPIYSMSSVLFPKGICNKIDALLRDFWWGKREGKGVLYLKDWSSMCKPKSVGGLGLRRTKDMNAALLAKMGWSMAILSSRELLSKGICWKIGDGRGLEAWDNPWIPSLEGFKPSPKSQEARHPLWVSELIINNPPRWDLDKLKNFFDDNTIRAIQEIHLSQIPQQNKMCWAPSSSGKFTAKSAYWLDQKPRFENNGPLTSVEWKSLWKLKIHDRLKLMLWKMAWGMLPTMVALNVRFRVNSTQCQLCNSGVETLEHLFIECPFARIAWYLSPWPIRFNVISPLSISEWIKLILNPADLLGCPKEEERHLTLFAAICCDMIWMKRNEATRKPEKVEPAKLAAQIKLNYTNHFQAREFQAQTRFQFSGWDPPPPPSVKINFDAALLNGKASVAAVCRNHCGTILFIWADQVVCSNPLIAEAQAALLASTKAVELGFHSVYLEGDALNVIQAIVEFPNDVFWTISNIARDISLLLSSIDFWHSSYVPRSCNSTAHNIAKWALFCNASGTIPISSLPAHVLAEVAEGSGSPAMGFYVGTSSLEETLSAEQCCSFRGSFSKLDVRSGTILWQTFMVPNNYGKIGEYAGAAIWGSSPSIDIPRNHVYIATGNLYSVPLNISQCQEKENNQTVPTHLDQCVEPDNHSDSILALDLDSGKIKWYHQLGGYDVWFLACNNLSTPNCPPGPNLDADFGEAPMMLSINSNNTVITPFLPTRFSRVSARKTRQPEPSRPDPDEGLPSHQITPQEEWSGAHFPKYDQVFPRLTRFDQGLTKFEQLTV